jgi:ABC-type iron transport system FetAB permease component
MKYYLSVILVLFAAFVCSWIFNHINPWVAILVALLILGIIIQLILNQTKKETK